VHQQALQNVLVTSQVHPTHAARLVAVGEGPLDALSPLVTLHIISGENQANSIKFNLCIFTLQIVH